MKKILFFLFVIIGFNIFAITLPNGTKATVNKIESYENGSIKKISFDDFIIQKTILGEQKFEKELSYYESGKILEGILVDTCELNTIYGLLEITGRILFYETGEIQLVSLTSITQQIETKYGFISVEEKISFYKNGNIESCQSYYFSTQIDIFLVELWLMCFDGNGNFSYVRFESGTIIDRKNDKYNTEEAYFNPDESILFAKLRKPIIIEYNGNQYIEAKEIFYHNDFTAYLPSKSIKIQGQIYGDNCFLIVDNNSKLVGYGLFDEATTTIQPFYF